jgi:hypothetical protein
VVFTAGFLALAALSCSYDSASVDRSRAATTNWRTPSFPVLPRCWRDRVLGRQALANSRGGEPRKPDVTSKAADTGPRTSASSGWKPPQAVTSGTSP